MLIFLLLRKEQHISDIIVSIVIFFLNKAELDNFA